MNLRQAGTSHGLTITSNENELPFSDAAFAIPASVIGDIGESLQHGRPAIHTEDDDLWDCEASEGMTDAARNETVETTIDTS